MIATRSGRQASQDADELRGFINLLAARGVRRYLEIGARHGDTFYAVMTALPEGSFGVALDLPGALWGRANSQSSLTDAVHELRSRGYQASVIFGDSRTDATRALARGRGPYDAVLIDGDHTLEGVTADWQNYGDLAPVIAFHDIVGEGQADRRHGRPVQVPALWAALRAKHETVEFVSPGSRMGIGVVLR